MMSTKRFLGIVGLCFLGFGLLPGCNSKAVSTLTSTATKLVQSPSPPPTFMLEPTSVIPSLAATELPVAHPQPGLQLTFLAAPREQKTYSVYAVPVGCLEEAFPCLGEPELLFEYPYPIVSRLSWSPDGQRVAFVSFGVGEIGDIFVSDWDAQNVTNITKSTAYDDFPAWSPDGSRIAYASYTYEEGMRIYSSAPDGSERKQLLTQADVNSPTQLNWSPDGKQLVFVGYDDAMSPANIYVANLDGTGLIQVTHAEEEIDTPAFSRDGSWIVFARDVLDELGNINNTIALIRPDGTGEVWLVRDAESFPSFPVWSPIGDWIAFASWRGWQCDIYLIKPDGTSLINVTETPDIIEWFPAWRIVTMP